MNRTAVDSKAVLSIGWEKDVLEVQYIGGDVYQYPGASQSDYLAAIDPKNSAGQVIGNVRKRHPGAKVTT